jgi:DNA-binding transcriptional LysR family regulator
MHLIACAAPSLLKAYGLPSNTNKLLLSPEEILRLPRLHLWQSPDDWLDFAQIAGVRLSAASWREGVMHSLIHMNYHAALIGIGVALLPTLFIDAALAQGTLIRLSDIELPQRRRITLIHRECAAVANRIAPFLHWLQDEHAA